MKFISKYYYILLNLVSLLLLLSIYVVPNGIVRVILAIPFLLFICGNVWINVLFPRRIAVNNIQRIVLSISLSIFIIIFTGLILNFTPWGINLNSIVTSLTFVVFVGSIVAFYRQQKLNPDERIQISIQFNSSSHHTTSLVLYLLLGVTVVTSIGIIGYHLINPVSSEKFTQFYLLDKDDNVFNYPTTVSLGGDITVNIGIANQEQTLTTYNIEVSVDGTDIKDIGPILLQNKQIWEEPFSYTTTKQGSNQQLDFVIFKDGNPDPYLDPLSIWFDVTSP